MTTTPNVTVRCSPNCAQPPAYLVMQEEDGSNRGGLEHACLVHLGVLVAKMVSRHGSVVVVCNP